MQMFNEVHCDCTRFMSVAETLVRHYGFDVNKIKAMIAERNTNGDFYDKNFVGVNMFFFVKYAFRLDAFGDNLVVTKNEFIYMY